MLCYMIEYSKINCGSQPKHDCHMSLNPSLHVY